MKKKSSHEIAHSAKPKPAVKIIAFATGLGALAGGLWALMYFSTPQSNLQPYKTARAIVKNKEKENAKETKNTKADKESSSNVSSPEPTEKNDESPKIDIDKIKPPLDIVKTSVSADPGSRELPKETLEHIQRGIALTEKGEYNAGSLEFGKAAELSPNSPHVYAIWATAMKMAKKYKGANKHFARAAELAGNDPEILFNWAMSRLEADENKEAGELLEEVVKKQPDNYVALNYLGKAYGRQKMYQKEEDAYREALRLEPNFAQAHFNLGIVLSIRKKFEEAAPFFEKAIEMDRFYEKPFVVQMLTALGRYVVPEDKKAPLVPSKQKKENEEHKDHAEHQEKTASAEKKEERKMEGSAGMEGSSGKKIKGTTNVMGKILINGEPAGLDTVVVLETKSKMKVRKQTEAKLTINQSDLKFVPRHSVVSVGSKVTFTNLDREVHNIYSKSINNQFNLGAMAAGSSKSISLDSAGPVVLRCNMHKDMIGTIFVAPNGYHTSANENGEYHFENIDSKNFIMQVWNPSLKPEEVGAHLKSADLTGVDQTIDFDIKSTSKPGDIHDLVEATDYNLVVDNIEKEMNQAIEDWKNGKKFISRKRMLLAITKHFDGGGLKGAIAKSFSKKRSDGLEKKLDDIRKKISGIGVSKGEVTEDGLKSQAEFAVSQLRTNVKELEARLNPDFQKDQSK